MQNAECRMQNGSLHVLQNRFLVGEGEFSDFLEGGRGLSIGVAEVARKD
jgi:hypothetical protein